MNLTYFTLLHDFYYMLLFYNCLFVCGSEDGYIYEKEAILQYILHQKTEIAKKMKVVWLFYSKFKCSTFTILTKTMLYPKQKKNLFFVMCVENPEYNAFITVLEK